MTKLEMMQIASQAYENAGLESLDHLFDKYGDPVKRPRSGDLLGRFIIQELHEVYDYEATDTEQRGEARYVMSRAAKDLAAVASAF